VETAPWQFARWILKEGSPFLERPEIMLPSGCTLARDSFGFWVVLLPSSWTIGYLEEKNADLTFTAAPPHAPPITES